MMKLVYKFYSEKHNAMAERAIFSNVSSDFAEQYINDNKNKPIYCYCLGLVDTEHYFMSHLETNVSKKLNGKVKD